MDVFFHKKEILFGVPLHTPRKKLFTIKDLYIHCLISKVALPWQNKIIFSREKFINVKMLHWLSTAHFFIHMYLFIYCVLVPLLLRNAATIYKIISVCLKTILGKHWRY
jgi:hypothetical protein